MTTTVYKYLSKILDIDKQGSWRSLRIKKNPLRVIKKQL